MTATDVPGATQAPTDDLPGTVDADAGPRAGRSDRPPSEAARATGADEDATPTAVRRFDRTGWLVALAVAVLATAIGVARHANWWSGGLDLGVFDQGVWLMSRGLSPEVTVNGRNLFADHLSPVLVLFVPLYRAWADPFWLFLAQGVAVGATVVPMRALARHEGAPVWAATVATAAAAPLWAAVTFDFHPSTLAVPFLAWSLLEGRRGNANRATVAGLLVVLCRAELAWLLVGVAIVSAPAVRRRLLVLAPLGMAAGFLVPSLLGARGTFAVHYGHIGSSPRDALLHPWRVVAALLSADTLNKAIIWLLPVGFLTARKPRWLAAVAVASLPMLLSRWAGMSLPWFHYAAPLMPLVIGGALAAVADPIRARPDSPLSALGARWCDPRVLAGAAVLSLVLAGPLSPAAPRSLSLWHVLRPEPGAHLAAGAAQVRAGEPVAASNRELAHLAHRRQAWLWPAPFAAGDTPDLLAPADGAAARRVHVVVLSGPDAEAWRRRHQAGAGHQGRTVDGDVTDLGDVIVIRR